MRWYILLSVLFLSSAVFARDLRMEELEEELQELGERSGPDPADSPPDDEDSRELVEDERDGGGDDDGQGGNDDGQGGNDDGQGGNDDGDDDDSEERDEKRSDSSSEENKDDSGSDENGDGTGGSSPTKRFYKRPSSCKAWWKYPMQTSKILYKYIHLQSYNYPKHYVSYDKPKVIIRDNFAASARFEVEPGKLEKCKGTVTFRSVNRPNLYLRHRGNKLYLTKLKTNLDYKDATFYPRSRLYGKWWHFWRKDLSFESFNYPDFFIRHQGSRVMISRNDRSKQFRKDATWKVVQ